MDDVAEYVDFRVDTEWIERAVRWACRRVHNTIDRPDMNERDPTERLDDIIMGEVGSTAVMQYLVGRGNHVVAYDDVRSDRYRDPDPGWDLAVGAGVLAWPRAGDDPRSPPRGESCWTISVKSSRIPEADGDSIERAIANRDFKILKNSVRIEDDLTADFEAQVYFPLATSGFERVNRVERAAIRTEDVRAIMAALRLEERYGRCYIVGFAARDRIIAHSHRLERRRQCRTWKSRHEGETKEMWVAPLMLGRMPDEP